MIYTGVGSRKIAYETNMDLQNIAAVMGRLGWTLRSGGATGSDSAFEHGCKSVQGSSEIYLKYGQKSKSGLVVYDEKLLAVATAIAARIHPAWHRCNEHARALHARNCFQVLGTNLDTPSDVLICWAPVDEDGIPTGGTRTAWILAKENLIPSYNINIKSHMDGLIQFVEFLHV